MAYKEILRAYGRDIDAVAGWLDVCEGGPVVLDGVGGTVHPPRHLDAWSVVRGSSS